MNLWEKRLKEFKEVCDHAVEISHENLRQLMRDNKDTAYGKKYHFDRVKSIKDYQELVPLSDYSYYQEFVDRMREGEKNMVTVYDVKHLIMSSGSSGAVKYLPFTTEAIRRTTDEVYYVSFACVPQVETSKNLHMSVFRMDLTKTYPETIMSAAHFRVLYDRGTCGLEERFIGGSKLLFSEGIGDIPYAKLWMALSEPEMTGIRSFFLYDVLLFLRYFEEHWESMLDDLTSRRIPEEIALAADVRENLLALPPLTDEWVSEIRRECEKGFAGILKRLWKKVNVVSGVGGATFSTQEAALRYYMGDVPLHYFGYAASEGLVGVVTELEDTSYVLAPTGGFFEFIPFGEGHADDRIRCIEELEVGKRYEIVITNFSGQYRYRLNDVVEIVGFYGQSPVMKMCFRKNQAINIAGEKMDMQTLDQAARELGSRCGLNVYEFSFYDDKTLLPGHYHCFLESHEIAAADDAEKTAGADEILDEILGELNEDYRDLRGLGSIAAPVVSFVPMGTHQACKRHFQKAQGQNKPMQYISDPEVIRFMKERIL